MSRKDLLSPRKQPRQGRSRQTWNEILEAAARVFGERGYAAGTTNHIARVAGVSIGSLYEYFPNKDAILVALAERHLERMTLEVERLLAEAQDRAEPIGALLHRFVTAMVSVHRGEPDLLRVLFSEAPHPSELHACVLRMEETLAHSVEVLLRQSPELALRDPDTAAHLVVQTVEALTHRFVQHGIHELEDGVFVEEVVRMLASYLRRGDPSAPRPRRATTTTIEPPIT